MPSIIPMRQEKWTRKTLGEIVINRLESTADFLGKLDKWDQVEEKTRQSRNSYGKFIGRFQWEPTEQNFIDLMNLVDLNCFTNHDGSFSFYVKNKGERPYGQLTKIREDRKLSKIVNLGK